MSFDLKAELRSNLLLQFLDRLILELLYGSAAGADQVVMVLTFCNMLVAGLTIAKVYLPGDTRFGKELQSPVHRGKAYGGVLRPDLHIEFFGTQVAVRGKKTFKNQISLTGGLEPFCGNKILELFLLGTFHKHASN